MPVAAVGGEYFQRGRQRGPRQSVRVNAGEKWPVNAFRKPMLADRLADGQDMRLVETAIEARSTVARCAESNALCSIVLVRAKRILCCHQFRHVQQQPRINVLPASGLINLVMLLSPSKLSAAIR